MNRMVRTFVLIILSGFFLAGCSEDSSTPTASIETITVAAYAGDSGMLVYLADELGYYRQNGLEVTIKDFESGKQATDAMLSGLADISTATDFVFVSNAFVHPGLRTIGTISMAQTNELVARKDRGIVTPEDLKGKKIGITRKSCGEFLLGRFLLFSHLLIEDVQIVDLNPSELVRAITSGQIDAVLTWDPNVYKIKQELRENGVSWLAQSDQDFYFILITHEEWLKQHSLAGRRFLKALIQAENYARFHKDEARAFIRERFNYNEEFADYTFSRHKFLVELPQALILALEDQAKWRIDNRLVNETRLPNYLNYIYPDFLAEEDAAKITVIR